ncbi:CoA transferase [Glutamicibacter sp. AOP38-B1-38]|uniref:CoA transferase n=1 Tax=Glutamicibacter sp. AOP38-B1-38 TaxID=3457680 RepID=UPI0040340B58
MITLSKLTLEQKIRASLAAPLNSENVLDPDRELAKILSLVGLDAKDGGGTVTFSGKDPILKSPWPLATMGGVALMAKSVAAADLWRHRTGTGQDLSLDLRRVPHRLCPFYDQKWELLNGYPPVNAHDPTNPFFPSFMYPTRDGRLIQLLNIYPKAKTKALEFLGCADNYDAIAEVTRGWDSFELEKEANRRGLQATVVRSTEEFLEHEQFPHLAGLPLIHIEKIGESAPEPFSADPVSPLDGVRALGLGHVIAGAGLGRTLAYHGADVLNIWRPFDFEMDSIYSTSSVGMRSATLEIGDPDGMSRMLDLARDCDVFFANRRPGYLNHFNLAAEHLAEIRPGIIHVEMSLYGPTGPWADRTGFDQNAGAVTGILSREGTNEKPQLTEIFVINDYAMSWLASMAVMATLKRRSVEGGSYKIHLSLARLSLWLIELGIFDKNYAAKVGATVGEHAFLDPEVFQAQTPSGHYQGVTDQVTMSETPGRFAFPLVPRGSSEARWLP